MFTGLFDLLLLTFERVGITILLAMSKALKEKKLNRIIKRSKVLSAFSRKQGITTLIEKEILVANKTNLEKAEALDEPIPLSGVIPLDSKGYKRLFKKY